MPQSFFEGATVTITDPDGASGDKMKVKSFFGNKPYSGPATVEFLRGDDQKSFATQDVTIKNGKLTAPVTQVMPDVNPKETSYDVRVNCKYKKLTKQMLFCTIWPKQTKILFQDPGNQPVKSVPFLLKQKGKPDQDLVSGTDGKSTIDLLERAPYSIGPKNAHIVVKDEQVTPGQYRDHKITVLTAIKARFQSPDISKPEYVDDADANPAAKKQWINLKSKEKEHEIDSGCDAKGHSVVFAVTADPPEDGQPGDRVYFEINFGKESKRNDPPPKLLDGWPVNELQVQDKKTTGYVVLTPVGDVPVGYFEVDLGLAGGDTCEVKIGGTSSVSDAKLKLINWRKVYTQITRTASLAKPSLAPAVACFKKVHIDLEEATADEVLVADTDVPGGSIVAGTGIKAGAPAQSLVVGDHNVAPFKTKLKAKFKADGLPVAHLIFCDYQLDANGTQYTRTVTLKGKKDGQVQETVDFPAGGTVPGVKVDATLADQSALFFPVDLTDGTDAVKSCTWKQVGGAGGGPIAKTDYKIDPVNSGNSLYIRLPDAAKTLSDGGSDIKLTVKVAYALGWYNGWCTSGDRHNVIAVGRADQAICGTIVHEIGHAIYQAAKDTDAAQFPGLPAPPHARFYTNNRGHMGPHCADGIDKASYDNPTARMDTANASSKCTCIMYGAGADVRNANLAFCDKCVPYVRAAVIKTVST